MLPHCTCTFLIPGAYKTHLFTCKLDLGPHDVVPQLDELDKIAHVEYNMPNSTVSRAQIRSISVQTSEDQPDKWVHHLAKYRYTVEIEISDQPAKAPMIHDTHGSFAVEHPTTPPEDESETPGSGDNAQKEEDSDSDSSSDSD